MGIWYTMLMLVGIIVHHCSNTLSKTRFLNPLREIGISWSRSKWYLPRKLTAHELKAIIVLNLLLWVCAPDFLFLRGLFAYIGCSKEQLRWAPIPMPRADPTVLPDTVFAVALFCHSNMLYQMEPIFRGFFVGFYARSYCLYPLIKFKTVTFCSKCARSRVR